METPDPLGDEPCDDPVCPNCSPVPGTVEEAVARAAVYGSREGIAEAAEAVRLFLDRAGFSAHPAAGAAEAMLGYPVGAAALVRTFKHHFLDDPAGARTVLHDTLAQMSSMISEVVGRPVSLRIVERDGPPR